MKNAITTFRNISLSAGSVEFWLATGARGTDYETLLLGWVQRDGITRCRPGGLFTCDKI